MTTTIIINQRIDQNIFYTFKCKRKNIKKKVNTPNLTTCLIEEIENIHIYL